MALKIVIVGVPVGEGMIQYSMSVEPDDLEIRHVCTVLREMADDLESGDMAPLDRGQQGPN